MGDRNDLPVGESAPGLAEAFADAVVRLNGSAGAGADRQDGLWLVARRLWQAATDGDVCVPLPPAEADLPDGPAITRWPLAQAAPIVIDDGHVYLMRLWRAETGVAARIREFDRPARIASTARIDAAVAQVFETPDPADAQQQAVRVALERRLCLITGGPGTGKTSTLARLLLAHSLLHPGARVAFAAPTGKAAARLAQALSQAISSHAISSQAMATPDNGGRVMAQLPDTGYTVHRLIHGGAGAPPLATLDLLIVDEASMLDLETAHALLSALGPAARLVLAGDRDQLVSVAAGSVFAELCEAPLQGRVRLTRNFRQREAPSIAALAQAVRDGDGEGIERILERAALCRPAVVQAALDDAMRIHAEAIALSRQAAPADEARALAVLQAYERGRVLCAQRGGPLGVLALNAAIATRLSPTRQIWYPGRLVIVARNDPARGLVNGDIGVCLARRADGGDLSVAFSTALGVRWVAPSQMPPCEDAWAITVHKSQGSEFDQVVLIPAGAGHVLDTRELIYTGITRARRDLVIRGSGADLVAAAGRPVARLGRLAARLGAASR